MAKRYSEKIKLFLLLVQVTSIPLRRTNALCQKKLEMKKFDPVVRQHVTYKEAKIK